MQTTTHYNLNKFESTDKMYQNTMNALNTNAETIDSELFKNKNDIAVHNYGKILQLVDGTPISDMENVNYYKINGLQINGVSDTDFGFSIVFFWISGSTQYVNYITKYSGHDTIYGKQYKYANGVWTVSGTTQKVNSITNTSTNDEIPTAKAVYDYIEAQITSAIGGSY